MKKIIKISVGVIAALLILPIGLALWIRWDAKQIRSFCDAAHPGEPATSLTVLAVSHGLEPAWVKGVYVKEKGYWYFFVPVKATMGDCGCRGTHDGKVILAATMACR